MRAVITGTGLVAPAARTALDPLHLPDGRDVPAEGYAVTGFNIKDHIATVTSYLDRCTALGLAAVKLALADAGVLERGSRLADWGLAYATAWGCLDSMELFFAKVAHNPKFAPPLVFSHSYANSPTSVICIEFGLNGTGATFSEGETGALTALGWTRDRLERTGGGEVEGMAVAASDALSHAVRLHLAATGDAVPGEAGSALTLELEEPARARGAHVLAAVQGWGSARGEDALRRAAAAALADAGAAPGDLAAVHSSAPVPGLEDRAHDDFTLRCGRCGPAGALLAVAEAARGPAGKHLVAASDPAGNAAALLIERAP